jgi:flagellar FliL protein
MDDTVITLLSTKTYEELYTAEGKEHLREEIMTILSEKLPDLQIISVYFTEFVVQ